MNFGLKRSCDVPEHVGEHEPALRVGVDDLDRLAGQGGDDVARALGVAVDGMFSTRPMTPTTLALALREASACMRPTTQAAPAMSPFMSSMPPPGLIEMPPESKHTPLPMNDDRRLVVAARPFQRMTTTRLSRAEPWPTASSARMPSFSSAASSSTSTSTPSLRQRSRAPRELLRAEHVRRLVDEVARQRDALGESLARLRRLARAGDGSAAMTVIRRACRARRFRRPSSFWSCSGRTRRRAAARRAPSPPTPSAVAVDPGRSATIVALRPTTFPATKPPRLSQLNLSRSFSPPMPIDDEPVGLEARPGPGSTRAVFGLPLKRSPTAARPITSATVPSRREHCVRDLQVVVRRTRPDRRPWWGRTRRRSILMASRHKRPRSRICQSARNHRARPAAATVSAILARPRRPKSEPCPASPSGKPEMPAAASRVASRTHFRKIGREQPRLRPETAKLERP